jgi:isochorismate hydrolase
MKQGIALETAYAVVHLCLEKRCQPSKLILEELARIDFPCERAHVLLHDKEKVFYKFTGQDLDSCKKLIKWCCKLRIGPETIFERNTIYF